MGTDDVTAKERDGTPMAGTATEGSDPAWLDRDAYPFDHHYAEVEPGRLHYVDEGSGRPVVMLHGNPTWSFLFRDVIRGISDEYRAVAVDLPGFGLSDKPYDWSYHPADHARVFAEFLDQLDLRGYDDEVTLLLHDWGGPIGLRWALDHPDRLRALSLSNTWLWPDAESWRGRVAAGLLSTLLGGPLGRVACEQYNAFARWLAESWARRDAIADVPTLLAWGVDDPVFGPPVLRRWQSVFDDHRTRTFDGDPISRSLRRTSARRR